MKEIVITAIITTAVTLIVTLLFNKLVSVPQKRTDRLKAVEHSRKEDLKRIETDLTLLKLGVQSMLKNDLKVRYKKWIALGYAPEDAKDDLEDMYQVYHGLGKNGVMDSHRETFLGLPDKPPIK